MKQIVAVILSMSALVASGHAAAQTTYPDKPIRLVVSFPPGSQVDIVARLLGQKFAAASGNPVLVDNAAGAAGNIGADRVAKAAPDGYTLGLLGQTQIVINPSLYKLLYDPVTDFAPVSQIFVSPIMLVVHNAVPAKNVQELIKLARRQPGGLTFASGGNGGSAHMAAALLTSVAGLDILHVPYKGAVAAIPDLLGGRVTMMFSPIAIVFSFEKFAEDLEAIIGAAGFKEFAFFGMAAGSAIGMAYAARHPQKVSRLVLYASYVRNKLAGTPTPQQVEEAQARLKMMELGWPNETPAYAQFYGSLHIPDASAEQLLSFADLSRRTTSPANAIALLRIFFGIDLREIVPKVRCPTLVLHSRGDSIIRFEEGRSVAALIAGARFVPLESRNHVLLDTEPAWQQFVAALDDFLPAPPASAAGAARLVLDELTARERQVLELVAQGLDNTTIGTRLHMSERTARNHVSAILAKLDINTRSQAIVRAREAGFGREKGC